MNEGGGGCDLRTEKKRKTENGTDPPPLPMTTSLSPTPPVPPYMFYGSQILTCIPTSRQKRSKYKMKERRSQSSPPARPPKKPFNKRTHRLIDRPCRKDVNRLYVRSCPRPVRPCDGPVRPRCSRGGGSPPRHAGDEVGVRFERLDAPSRDEVPCSDCLVVGGGEEKFAGGVEDEGADPVVVYGRPESAGNEDEAMREAYGRPVE